MLQEFWLMWYDDTKKKPLRDKIAEGALVFRDRFGEAPRRVQVNPEQVNEASKVDLTVESSDNVRKNLFYFGPVYMRR